MQTADRGRFGSSFGFVLAAAGSAIGLGNIWGFPFIAAESGGGAFVLLYLVCVLLVGVPVMYCELVIGRAAQKSPVGAFARLAPGTRWPLVGALGVTTGFFILAFYSLVAGWTVGYLGKALIGGFSEGSSLVQSELAFGAFKGSLWPVFWTFVFFLMSALVVRAGVSGGIERVCKVLMPVFFLLLIGLAVRSVTLPGGMEGVRFLFDFDLSEVNHAKVVANALAQALFSLSLGMGAMITYGSYLAKKENLGLVGVSVAFFDTLIAILAGLMIFPALFHAGGTVEKSGEGLVFEVLPTIFDSLPMGGAFAVAFYGLLVIAALTSSISLLEVLASYFVDEKDWPREKAVWIISGLCFLVSIPCSLYPPFMGWLVKIFWITLLPLGAVLILLFIGWKWGLKNAYAELTAEGGSLPFMTTWGFFVKFVCPVLATLILAFSVYQGFFG